MFRQVSDKIMVSTVAREHFVACIPLIFVLPGVIIWIGFVGAGTSQPQENSSAPTQKNGKEPADDFERLRPKVRLGKVPTIALDPRKSLTKERADQIKTCIARLAEIDSPDIGFSTTMSGQAFLPLPNQQKWHGMVLTDHQLKSSSALKKLVEFGPDALPFLLEALDDKTPTKIKIKHTGIGAMWLANELWGNPVNELELKTLGPPKANPDPVTDEAYLESYTVKVGDVCLVAIGQIVGRGYQAVRYQPTACIVVNSPTGDTKLREQVRKIWSSDDPTRKLLDSLLLDYGTEGVFQGPSLDSWGLGSELQTQAVIRMLYYYPKQTAALISARLGSLDVKKTSAHGDDSPATADELDAYARREVANGVGTVDFVEAVSWCPERPVREAIRTIFRTTTDVSILLAALPGVQDSDRELILDRLQTFLDYVPVEEEGAFGDGYKLLAALAVRLDKSAAPVFERYLKNAPAQRCHSAAEALKENKGAWSLATLRRLLDDKRRVGGYTYAVRREDQNTRLPIRVCDASAETLRLQYPEFRFILQGEYADLDKQVNVIRAQLDRLVQ